MTGRTSRPYAAFGRWSSRREDSAGAAFGEVSSSPIIKDNFSGESRGFEFWTFDRGRENHDSAAAEERGARIAAVLERGGTRPGFGRFRGCPD